MCETTLSNIDWCYHLWQAASTAAGVLAALLVLRVWDGIVRRVQFWRMRIFRRTHNPYRDYYERMGSVHDTARDPSEDGPDGAV